MAIKKVYKRNQEKVSFNQEKITQAIYKALAETGEPEIEKAKVFSNKVVQELNRLFPNKIPGVEDIQDIVEETLIKEGHKKASKAYILYRQKRKEIREKKEKEEIQSIPYKVLWETLVWNIDHQCETIEKINKIIKEDKFKDLVFQSEKRYHKKILEISSAIKKRKKEIKLFIITGPSSSGKTTTTELLGKELEKQGISFLKINVDNYFYSPKKYLKDRSGDYDFEGPYALNLDQFNKHLEDLLNGKEVKTPFYDFKTGQRKEGAQKLKLKKNQVVLIDSHFGIYPKLSERIPKKYKYIVYLEPFSQIRDKDNNFVKWTDIRMLRRMIRDAKYRSYNPQKTVGHWHYVRKAEKKNIFPYLDQADYILNTSLPYESPILKKYIFDYFPEIIKIYSKDDQKKDPLERAQRVYQLLKQVTVWPSKKIVPKNSILREFIG